MAMRHYMFVLVALMVLLKTSLVGVQSLKKNSAETLHNFHFAVSFGSEVEEACVGMCNRASRF